MKRIVRFSKICILISLLLVLNACYFDHDHTRRIEGSGAVVERIIDLDNFVGIVIQNSARVYIREGRTQKVVIEAPENIIRNLETNISGQVWRIRNRRPVWHMKKLIVRITLPDFKLLKISGSGSVQTDTPFNNLDDLELNISGSGTIHVSGEARSVKIRVSGSGDIFADELKALDATARVSGSGSVSTYVTKHLDARISGSGAIIYKGQPKIKSRISGSGNIRSK